MSKYLYILLVCILLVSCSDKPDKLKLTIYKKDKTTEVVEKEFKFNIENIHVTKNGFYIGPDLLYKFKGNEVGCEFLVFQLDEIHEVKKTLFIGPDEKEKEFIKLYKDLIEWTVHVKISIPEVTYIRKISGYSREYIQENNLRKGDSIIVDGRVVLVDRNIVGITKIEQKGVK